jgi:tol-pal system protein YbgF
MKLCRLTPLLLAAAPFVCLGQRKEYVELQRDIAILQDQVRTMKSSVDENFTRLTVLVQQSLDGVNKANTSVVVLENNMRERLREQEKSVSQPVANIGAKVDEMASELLALKESVADLNARFGKLELQLVDVANAIRTIQAPLTPPGGAPGSSMSATEVYQNALRDKQGGNLDLALKGFTDYLQNFGNTDLAPNAQFYVGEIYYQRDQYDEAVNAFEAVLDKYPENNKTPDAHYMKGVALVKMGQRNNARDEFYVLIKKYPSAEVTSKAKAQLKGLGLPVAPPKGKRR